MQTILHYWNGIGASLPTIAGLTPCEEEIKVIDENLDTVDFEEPCDIVGITGMTQQAKRAYEIADTFKSKGRHVAMGGIHVSVMPDEAKAHADTVFIGEAEKTWPLFLKDFIAGDPQPFYNQSDSTPVEMNKIPMPRYDLLSKYDYPVIWIQSSRGCPHDCEFCAASKIFGRKHKHKNTRQVIEEIQSVKRHWKYATIGFADDNMFLNRDFSWELVLELKKINFNWYAQSDISVAEDTSFLRLLHESGCRILFIGFESVKKENLTKINRNHWKERLFDTYTSSIEKIQGNGIGIYGSFIIGLEKDDTTIFDETIDFIDNNHLLGAQITILTPLPGSRLRSRLEKEKRITSNDWSHYTGWNAVFRQKNLTANELETGLLRIYKKIYREESYKKRAAYFRRVCEDLIK